MKNILLIISILFLFSCRNTPTKVENPEKATTLEILELANQDTTCVKVVELGDVVYVVNNGLVTHEVTNDSGFVNYLSLVVLFLLTILIVFGIILKNVLIN